MSRRKLLVADLLCGAGGSTTGCERALVDLGIDMADVEFVCVNHWQTAIDTHSKNHPRARHHVQDIATGRPHLMVPEGYLDLLMASPTCTHHSVARGGKPTSDQQRSDPWHIITWLTELRVKRMIIENVWEFTGWGPVDPKTGKPIKERKGEYFNAWIDTIRRLGFEPEWKKLNAADFGDATTRKRFILMARSDAKRVRYPQPTHMKNPDGELTLFPTMKPWRAAREIIDWKIKGRSIFGRGKDLAPNTIARIYAGAVTHGWPDPYLVILRNHMSARGLDLPIPALTASGQHIGLAEPVLINLKKDAAPRSTEDQLPALTASASHVGMAEAFVLSQHSSGAARPAGQPLPTIMTGGAGAVAHPGCARPALIEPFILSQGAGGAPRPVSRPSPTIPTHGAHALIAPYYSNGWQKEAGTPPPCYTDDTPLPPVTTKGRFGMVVPVTNSNGGPSPRSLDEPIPTATTAKGGEFAMVMPVTHHDTSNRTRDVEVDPIPTATGANRGELAFITAQHGERPGQAPRVHSLEVPTPTIAATGHVDLVAGVDGYDILFRMLEPHELAAAMGFTSEEHAYEFAGNKTEQIKQIGNAVSVAMMKACVTALMADAAPRRRAAPQVLREEAA